MGEEENTDKYGEKETECPNVMEANRNCRDIFCLLLFLIAWIGWIIVAAMAFTDGCPDNCNDPRKLVFGFDSNGCMCGKDCSGDPGIAVDNSGKKRLYIPDPREASLRICVAECPPAFAFSKNESLTYGTYQCDKDCTAAASPPTDFYLQRSRGDILSASGSLDNCFISGSREGDCWFPSYPTSDVFYKCIPALPADLSAEDVARMEKLGLPAGSAAFGDALAVMQNPAGEFGKLTGEVTGTWPLLLISVFIAVFIGFLFLLLIRLFALPMMWFIVIGLIVMLVLSTVLAWDKTGKVEIFAQLSDATGQNISALADAAGDSAGFDGGSEPAVVEAVAWILTVVTIAYLVLLIFFLKRIVIAVKIIVEAAKCMQAVKMLVLQPLWTFLSLALLYTWAGFITVYLVSAGEFDPATGSFSYAGGTCASDLSNATLSVTHSTTLVTILLGASAPWLRETSISNNAGTSWITTNGVVEISHPDLQGVNCSFDSTLMAESCVDNTNTTSNNHMLTGGCFGQELTPTCLFASGATSPPWLHKSSLRSDIDTQGEVSWDARLGRVQLFVNANTTLQSGDKIEFALNIRRCGADTPGACGTWDLAGNVKVGGVERSGITYTLKSTEVSSSVVIGAVEATRSCNLYSTLEKATAKLRAAKEVQLGRQGKADLRELRGTSWSTKPTIDNWKGFLPVTLDGNTYNYFVLYHLFLFLWTNNFTVSSGYYIICGAVAAWYWSIDKKDLPRGMLAKSTYRYVRYNLGTVAFGSFIIAVVQMIRILFNYFVSKSEQFKENPVVKALVCVVNCCLWCLEKVIGYINKNAYIMSATHGFGFCKAAFKGFMLLMRNLLRVAAVNVVAVAILFFGKIFITLATLCVSYFIAQSYAAELNLKDGPPFLSLVIIGIMAWFVGSSFMNTYAAAVDTIFLSFLHDQESNDGSPGKPYYMADSLRSSIGVKNAKVTPGENDPPKAEAPQEREGALD